MGDGRLVWDSDSGPVDEPPRPKASPPAGDGIVRVRRETGGRGGKTVTTVRGLPAAGAELSTLAKALKRHCGVGGSVVDQAIELQGDHRERVVAFLEERGHRVKLAGG
ncbi:MAG: hypothetical protein AAF628_32520 [Planctomycetota bacterium]